MCRRLWTTSDSDSIEIQASPFETYGQSWRDALGIQLPSQMSLCNDFKTHPDLKKGDSNKLQRFADMCADVDSQLDFLPGLGCLNYPSAIGPIVENLPNFICSKWEKRVVQYTEDYNDAYPGFKEFAAIRIPSHPRRQADLAATRRHGKESKQQQPSWLGRLTPGEYESTLASLERYPSQPGKCVHSSMLPP